MKIPRLGLKAMRVVVRAVAATLGLTAATSAFGTNFRPFPAALSLPQYVAANTVVARGYITPQQLCGEGTCTLVRFVPVSMISPIPGSVAGMEVNGPIVITQIKGLRMQVLVNGNPQTRLREEGTSITFSSPIEIQLLRDSTPELVNGISDDRIQFGFSGAAPRI